MQMPDSFNTSLSDMTGAIGDIIGTSANINGTGTASSNATNLTNKSGRTTSQNSTTTGLNIDQAAVNRIIQDVLGGSGGLASIFAGEQSSGLYNSSASAQAAGNLVANLVGEIAKLTATQTEVSSGNQDQNSVISNVSTDEQKSSSTQRSDNGGGLFGSAADLFGW